MMPRLLLLVARVWMGVIFLKSGWDKVTSGWIANQQLLPYLTHSKPLAARGFFEHTLPAHATLVSYLVVGGELGIGACLVLGFLTRWAALAGFLLMALFAASAGTAIDPTPPVGFAVAFLALAASEAGQVAGVDRWIRNGRAPSWVA